MFILFLYLKVNNYIIFKITILIYILIIDVYVALLIAQKYSKQSHFNPIILKDLAICLRKLAQFAKNISASAHLPRIGARTPSFNWYNTERYIRKELCGKNIPTYIYYYKHGVTPKTPRIITKSKPKSKPKVSSLIEESSPSSIVNTLTNEEEFTFSTSDENADEFIKKYNVKNPFPSYFSGLKVGLQCESEKDRQTLRKFIIAHGGTIVSSTLADFTIGNKSKCVSAKYIVDCSNQKKKLDWTKYIN